MLREFLSAGDKSTGSLGNGESQTVECLGKEI